MLMSNKVDAWPDAKYQLNVTKKVHLGASDEAYRWAFRCFWPRAQTQVLSLYQS